MNVPYLLQIFDTEELSKFVAEIDLPPLDLNLAIWDSIDRKEIEVDEENDKIKLLIKPEPSSDDDMRNKVLRVIQHYAKEDTNITRGRLNNYIKDPLMGSGYPWHEYIMAVQHLIDDGIVEQDVIDVPAKTQTKIGKKGKKKLVVVRPAHKFAFLGLAENSEVNAEWNAKAVNKWMEDIDAAIAK